MVQILPLLFLILGYLIGSFPTAYFVVKSATGKDIRHEETGNVGAMNTARTTGKPYLFVLVFLVDAFKGILGVFLPTLVHMDGYNLTLSITLCAFGVVTGHCYSIYFKIKDGKFSGGKGIASMGGILAALSITKLLLPVGIVMLVPIVLAGNLLLSQFVGAVALPFIAFFFMPEYFLLTILCVIPILIKQWPRVIPALQGKEPKWYFKGRKINR